MPTLRFRVELNKGGVGVTMAKLASITEETEKFLKMLSADIDVEDLNGQWIAKDFENASVDFTAEYIGAATEVDANNFDSALMFITSEKINFEHKPTKIRSATIMQYANIANVIDPDEVIQFGIFNGNGIKEHRTLSKSQSIEIHQKLETNNRIKYLGSIQGVIHSIITEPAKGKNNSFKIRELYSDNLIKCFYETSQYNELVKVLKKQGAVVHVSGWITGSKIEQRALFMNVEKLVTAVEYQEGDLDKFIGMYHDEESDRDEDTKH